MVTMSPRASARLLAAPLVLTVLVTGQAAGAAHASPAPTTAVAPAAFTRVDEQQVLDTLARERTIEAEKRAEKRAERLAREAAAIGQRIVAAAAAQAGKPYVYGATGPSAFDCSGLTGWAYAAVGIHLPRTSGAQAAVMTRVSDPMPGDLVYMPGHIGIYAGNGQMWHAPHTGDVVRLSTIWTDDVVYGRVR
ncbi:C40 family peptidase [Nocardioides jiangxiensis]|uniref:C40 family peptidase n=1 Tax=Nocardioides jiangxiensis TaxID=3064524 RepID=A0ABT9B1U2_9ACTN|nr:C40 family peptidase [Nocardioides sp. WY-20]MDO7868720.1 C40 family peptidase [Nocardioides sp. WY-20]